jgi:hypothetical protein
MMMVSGELSEGGAAGISRDVRRAYESNRIQMSQYGGERSRMLANTTIAPQESMREKDVKDFSTLQARTREENLVADLELSRAEVLITTKSKRGHDA